MASNSVEELYPVSCAFCTIADAYPSDASSIPLSPDPAKISPQCQLILSTSHVLAFLDIMPIAPGHVLLISRKHYEKLTDMHNAASKQINGTWDAQVAREHARETARQLGEWLPRLSAALCKVTGVEDWNVVQNNGARAAQVVPHLHFHLIPRYQEGRNEGKGNVDLGMLKSWKMFGRGAREDLDEEEGQELARLLREVLRQELEGGKARL